MHGQTQNYQIFNSSNGLASNENYDVIQDDFGYIWISSDLGLHRYDGYQFDHFTTENGLLDNVIFNFFKHPNGDIWCSTKSKKIIIISGENPEFKPYPFNSVFESIGKSMTLSSIVFENEITYFTFRNSLGYLSVDEVGNVENNVDVHHNEKDLYVKKLDPESNYYFVTNENGSQNSKTVIKIEKRLSGKNEDGSVRYEFGYWECIKMAENSGLAAYYGTSFFLYNEDTTIRIDFDQIILRMGIYANGDIWLATHSKDGLYRISPEGQQTKIECQGNFPSGIFEDHSNNVWISTLTNGTQIRTESEVEYFPALTNTHITSVVFDKTNKSFVGTNKGEIFISANGGYKSYYSATDNNSAHVALLNDQVYFTVNSKLLNESLYCILPIGPNTSLFQKNTNSTKYYLYNSTGLHITEGSKLNEILYGINIMHITGYKEGIAVAADDGVYLIDSDLNQIHFDPLENRNTRINVLATVNNTLILGTYGNGLVFLRDSLEFNISTSDGLPSAFITDIYIENDSNIWVGTSSGICLLTKTLKNPFFEVLKLQGHNQLSNNFVTTITTHENKVYVGTRKGLNTFNKKIIHVEKDSVKTFLKINSWAINDIQKPLSFDTSLHYQSNRILFNFSEKSYSPNLETTYRYKLLGADKDWTSTTNTHALYLNLKPGNYTFYVQSKIGRGFWSETQFAFSISPPYYKTWWFISVLIGLLLSLIYAFFKFRILIYNRTLVRELLRQILKRIKKDRHYILVKSSGNEIKIYTASIHFIKSDGNYLEIHTDDGKHTIREKIGNFMDLVPDPIEFLRVRRSFIVRIDKVTKKGKKQLFLGDLKIEVGETYLDEIKKIQL